MRRMFFFFWKELSCWLVLLILSLQSDAQPYEVEFNMYAPGLADSVPVYITGSPVELGLWNPGAVSMEALGKHRWHKKVTFPAVGAIEYKYTLGAWEREAANAEGQPLPNYVIEDRADWKTQDTVEHWTEIPPGPSFLGQITGKVVYHDSVPHPGVLPRRIAVWLPPGYDPLASRRYPVIYMQDGQNLFDPSASAFGIDWQMDEAADSMIRSAGMPPAIIVGIYNTSERASEYHPGEKSQEYMKYIVNTVKPFMDVQYRTLPNRKHTIAGGSSSGGILAFMLVWEHADVFSKAICMSPAFRPPADHKTQWDYATTVLKTSAPPEDVYFYIYNGGIELEEQLQPGIDDMLVALRSKGYPEGENYLFVQDKNAEHNESAWARSIAGALRWVLDGP